MKYNKLGSDNWLVSHIGIGGAAFSEIYGAYNEAKGVELIQYSLSRGVNYFETGHWYGQGSSEVTFGKALQGIPRDSFFIASKVGRYEKDPQHMFDFSYDKTISAVNTSLERLHLPYLDLVQVHDGSFASDPKILISETIPALAHMIAQGKIRFLGIADYDLKLMRELVETSPAPIYSVSSHSKSTLFDNRLQDYIPFFLSKGVGVINAAPTGMGLLTNAGPQPWHPASEEIKMNCYHASAYCQEEGVDLARLAIWHSLQQPGISTHLCGVTTVEQMQSTLDLHENGISEHEGHILEQIQKRFFSSGPQHWDYVETKRHRIAKRITTGPHE